ncbi:MAG: type III-A CRISPR-associated RAMP protein Csm5 [Bdellovibrionales bacterium]|nr:type III-A CRISPR-associated RAMP protein Csm5 [Bdellovibrionales bacterium]
MKNKGKNFSEKMILETYTPLHIGSGEELKEDVDFIKENNSYFVVDIQKTLDSIQSEDRQLNKYFDTAQLTDLLKISEERQGYTLNPLTVNNSLNGKKDIREYLKDVFFKPILPGTSLKGGIRTALWNLGLRKNNNLDYIGKKLEKEIFGSNPQKDIMRCLKVSDAYFEKEHLALGDIRITNVSNNKIKWKNLATKKNIDEWELAKGIYPEVVKAESKAEFLFSWDEFLLNDISWTDINNNIKNSLGSYSKLKDFLNDYALRMIENEIQFFKTYEYPLPIEFYEKLKSEIEKDKTNTAWLRLSWGSVWTGMTGLTNELLNEPYMKDIKQKINQRKKNKNIDYPKTRRLLVDKGNPQIPMGWVKLYPSDETVRNPYRKALKTNSKISNSSFSSILSKAIQEIKSKNNIPTTEEVFKGKSLADYYQNIKDLEQKKKVQEEIKKYWIEKEWWDNPSRNQKKLKAIYEY